MTSDDPTTETQLRRALTSLRDMRERLERVEAQRSEPIAIVGMGCRLPRASDPEQFWTLLREGGDAIAETPPERWDVTDIFDVAPEAPGKVATRWGGYLDQIDGFDAAFFGISPREAAQMDPQQRLLLEVAWETFEDAGHPLDQLGGSDTGVFVGVHSHSSDYYLLQAAEQRKLDLYSGTGTSHSVASGRLSYSFDLRGPSIAIDTACSSSLVAVHLAVRSLRNHECSLALAGGVNAMIEPTFTMVASRMRMMSPSGRCRPFDADGDGFVRSEGCGAVLLKRLSDAVADGDHIVAVIRGSAVNQDGRSNGLTAPNSLSQQAVIRAALDDAGVSPAEVGLIETHGTGTPLGDPIELEALAEVFGGESTGERVCALGSAKANIGHCEGAAGVAGVIKAVLSLRAREVPEMVHFRRLNPHISLDGTPFDIPTQTRPWSVADGETRCAGVSSFGWSGTNAHVVLTEPPEAPIVDRAGRSGPFLLPISARSDAALLELASAHRRELATAEPAEVDAVCVTAALRRSHLERRLVVAGRTRDGLVEGLDAFVGGDAHRDVAVGDVTATGGELVVFVCPGQGSQWTGMARQLIDEEPAFRVAIERCDRAMSAFVDWSLVEHLKSQEHLGDRSSDIDVVQPTLFAIQVALAALWRSYGVEPDAVVGHSMGEVAAAHIAGILSLDDAARVICVRSRLLRRISGEGAMAVVELDVEGAQRAIAGMEERLAIAVSNARSSTVVSGDEDALDEVMSRLEGQDVFCRRVQVDVASHSPQVDGLLGDLVEALEGIDPQPARVPFLSTVTVRSEDGPALHARYWAENLRRPVQFAAAIEALIADGHGRFVELSPHPLLLAAIDETLSSENRPGVAIASMHRDCDERVAMYAALGALYADGHPLDWRAFHGGRDATVALPRYPWQRERHWLDVPEGGLARRGHKDDPLLGWRVPLVEGRLAHVWENAFDAAELPALYARREDGRAVLPASAVVEMMLRAAEASAGSSGLLEVSFDQRVELDDDPTVVQVIADLGAGLDGQVEVHRLIGDRWVRLAKAAIAPTAAGVSVSVEPPPEAESISGEALYGSWAQSGVELGDRLRCITSFRRADGLAGADVDDRSRSGVDFADLEACVQVAAGIVHDTLGDGAGCLVPVSIASVHRSAGSGRPTTGRAAIAGGAVPSPDAPSARVDVVLGDGSGHDVVTLGGLVLERRPAAVAGSDGWFHHVVWRPVGQIDPVESAPSGPWLVFADDGGHGEALAEAIRALGGRSVVVTRGERYEPTGPDRCVVRAHEADDLRRLLEEYAPDRAELVFMWGLDAPGDDELTATDLADAQRVGCGVLLDLARAMASGAQRCRIRVVTKGVQRVRDDDAGAATAQSPLWGFGRAFEEELSDVWAGLVDLDPAESPSTAAGSLAAVLLGAGDDTELALRNGERFVSRLVHQTITGSSAVRLRSDATVLVTGGFGAVGRDLNEWLIEHGARRIVLMGRTALPARAEWSALDTDTPAGRRAAYVQHLERLGASVHVASVDVGDAAAIRAFLDEFRSQGWPPIRSVFHAAALFGGELVHELDHDILNDQLMPKLVGAWTFAEELELDHLVLFSSIAAMVPMAGQSAYAAANAFLDALAMRRAAQGQPALSVNWGFWEGSSEVLAGEAGQARDGDGPAFKDTANLLAMSHGMYGFQPEQGLEALGRLMVDGATHSIVVPIDWTAFGRARQARPLGLATEMIEAAEDPSMQPESSTTLVAEVERCAPGDREEVVEAGLRRVVGRVLKLPESRIGELQPFGNLGLDSLMAIELRNQLELEIGVKLSATVAWNYPTVRELGAFVLEKLAANAATHTDVAAAPESDAERGPSDVDGTLREIAELSDDDALAALIGEERS